ncbi:MAG: hypothetical protein GXP24_08360 [Planctomycetes bacterium]|nr:hypothetical protein [Planctomycetota bacterium]
MSRDRPLTWLFVAATIAVDLAWVAMIRGNKFVLIRDGSMLLLSGGIGLFFAQSCVLAIIVMRQKWDKLTQASFSVVVNGILAGLVLLAGAPDFGRWFVYFAMHAVQAIVVSILWQLMRQRRKRLVLWKVSLMEIFGWTTLVAILSFGFRFMDFSRFRLLGGIALLAPSLLLTIEANWGYRLQNRVTVTLRLVRFFFITAISIAFFYFVTAGYGLITGAGIFSAYALYLCVWVVVGRTERKTEEFEHEVKRTERLQY